MKRYIYHRFEVVTALGVLLWGLWLLNPAVNSLNVSPAWARWQSATEEQWGGAAVLIGLLGIIGLERQDKALRKIGMAGAIAFRTFTFLFIGFQNNFASNGTPDFFLWMVIAGLAYYWIDNT